MLERPRSERRAGEDVALPDPALLVSTDVARYTAQRQLSRPRAAGVLVTGCRPPSATSLQRLSGTEHPLGQTSFITSRGSRASLITSPVYCMPFTHAINAP